jgi:hypothetical protein
VGSLEIEFTPSEKKFLYEMFPVRTNLTPVNINGLKEARVYRDRKCGVFDVYSFDHPALTKIGCNPSLVGSDMQVLVREAAEEAACVIKHLGYIENPDNVVLEDVYRAGPGYELLDGDALGKILNNVCSIRAGYKEESYQDHVNKIPIIHNENHEKMPSGMNLGLIIQDTQATGRSGEIVINRAIEVAKMKGSKIDWAVLYGFIAEPALQLLSGILERNGIRGCAICIPGLLPLSTDGYTMPLYGVDVKEWLKTGSYRLVGAAVSKTTFEEWLYRYIIGSDPPGDWSAKQDRVPTGVQLPDGATEVQYGGIVKHLFDTLNNLWEIDEMLRSIPWLQKFYPKFRPRIYEERVALGKRISEEEKLLRTLKFPES